MPAKILIAEDERIIRNAIRDLLVQSGYEVVSVADGLAAVQSFSSCRPDLVLLDIMMPRMDGREACLKIRSLDRHIPIMFLTALNEPVDEIKGLECGADDYVAKTAPTEVLLARIEAALRRADETKCPDSFAFGSWNVSAPKLAMFRADGARAELTEREAALLRDFSAHPDEVFSRDYISRTFCDETEAKADGMITMFVKRLRDKLGEDAKLIHTVRGVGYAFRPN